MAIQIKSIEQLKSMRKAGLVVAHALGLMKDAISVGVTTKQLDAIAVAYLNETGAIPSFLNYHGYPAVICASINHQIVHGIPNDRPIKDGDLVSIDFGAIVEGWHGDSAISVVAGNVDPHDQHLMDTCEESMWRGIAAATVGGHLTDISFAIESYINSQGKYGILREYGGHGIGTEMHMEPHILNYGKAGLGPTLKAGMAFAIEPMITRGGERMVVLDDEWTVVSADKSRGAHFEHTFALLPDGKPFVLTAIDGGKERLGALGIEISPLLS
ncbi:MAG: type I methionyl aminopeptidase [Actinomycetes bacterium]|jgi:methionyl aminopeptidase